MNQTQEEPEMADGEATALPLPAFAGGTTAITLTPAVAPPAWWAEMRIPLDGPVAHGS